MLLFREASLGQCRKGGTKGPEESHTQSLMLLLLLNFTCTFWCTERTVGGRGEKRKTCGRDAPATRLELVSRCLWRYLSCLSNQKYTSFTLLQFYKGKPRQSTLELPEPSERSKRSSATIRKRVLGTAA